MSKREARKLPEDFDINKLLHMQRQPIHIQEAQKLRDYTLDEAIESRWVQVKDAKTGQIDKPLRLESLIASIDRSTQSVILVSMKGPTPDTALVAVQARSELLGLVQSRQTKKSTAVKVKQIELNWAISQHDLELKLKKMGEFLAKGNRVEMLLANKKRQRRAERDEAEATLRKVREKIQELGAGEMKLQGSVGQQATILVEKAQSPQSEPAATKHADSDHSSPPS